MVLLLLVVLVLKDWVVLGLVGAVMLEWLIVVVVILTGPVDEEVNCQPVVLVVPGEEAVV